MDEYTSYGNNSPIIIGNQNTVNPPGNGRGETSRIDEKEKILALNKEKESLLKQLEEINAELIPLSKQRESSFRDCKPKWFLSIGIVLILCAIGLIVFMYCQDHLYGFALGAPIVALGIFFLTRASTLKDMTEKRRNEAFRRWENDPLNAVYTVKMNRKAEINQRIKEIESALKKEE